LRKKLSPRFSIKKAHEMQLLLSKKLILKDKLPEKIEYVAGVDVAYFEDISIGAVAVLDFSTLSLIEFQVSHFKTRIPYVPKLLSFREIPPAYLAIIKLDIEPDVFLVDGQGFAHPYGLGFASHLGLILDKPTVGVAKSWLFGKLEPINQDRLVVLLKERKKIVGAKVTTKPGTKPVYVSIGHKISLKRAVELVMDCARKYRLPEPIRSSHNIANNEKRKFKASFSEH
jgi:deoxyribonuclease V